MKSLILALAILISNSILAQPTYYSVANAHSHNDYEQQAPFYNAYNEEFGSIEADIHLVNGTLLVGHDKADLSPEKTLENLYLIPLKDSKIQNRSLQLLIDIKTFNGGKRDTRKIKKTNKKTKKFHGKIRKHKKSRKTRKSKKR